MRKKINLLKVIYSVMLNDRIGYKKIKENTQECEKYNFDSIWIPDHLQRETPNAECWTTLSALAEQTDHIRLGSMVTNNSLRLPSVFGKMIANIDNISNGRVELGIGAGWVEKEYQAYGIEFPNPMIRIAQLVEGIKILKIMWNEGGGSFEGKYYRINNLKCEPLPVQKPHPPILIGSSGGKMMRRVAAIYADKVHIRSETKYNLFEILKKLKKECLDIGRPYDSIVKTASLNVIMSSNDLEIERKYRNIYSSRPRTLSYEDWLKVTKEKDLVGRPEDCIDRIREYLSTEISYLVLNFPMKTMSQDLKRFNDSVIATTRG